MNLQEYLNQLTGNVIDPILEYMHEAEIDDFTEDDVQECRTLLADYLAALASLETPSDEAIMDQVKTVVLALNDLNERLDYALIQTEERENIWELIQTSAVAAGLREYGDDITEQWREW